MSRSVSDHNEEKNELATPSVTDGELRSIALSCVLRPLTLRFALAGETDNEWDEDAVSTPIQEDPSSPLAAERERRPSHVGDDPRSSIKELSLRYLQRPTVIFANIDLFRQAPVVCK